MKMVKKLFGPLTLLTLATFSIIKKTVGKL